MRREPCTLLSSKHLYLPLYQYKKDVEGFIYFKSRGVAEVVGNS